MIDIIVWQHIYPVTNILPGYEHDILISYCQNDKWRDGPVSVSVENLKEPDATCKEEIE